VAIIGILASFLLPSLAKARRSVQTTACLNKEKQIGIASLGYAGDYGYFTTLLILGNFSYLPFNTYAARTSDSEAKINDIRKRSEILRCPADETFGWSDGSYWRFTSYGTSEYLPGKQISKIARPSIIIYLIDTKGNYTFSATGANIPAAQVDSNRHNSGWNALFVDGHAQWGNISKFKISPGNYSNIYPVN
jgi:prepilin-type processing-associated H-X9-DG protein